MPEFEDQTPANEQPLERLSNSEATTMATHMSNIAQAGLPMSAGLRALSEEVPSRRIRSWLRTVSQRLEQGQSLTTIANEAHGAWPRYFLAMLEAGQRTGRLSETLNECVVHLRTTADARRHLWLALAYPLVLLLVSWLVLSFMATLIVPQLDDTYQGFGIQLPMLTIAIVAISHGMQAVAWWSLPTVLATAVFLWRRCDSWGLAVSRDWLSSRIPVLGEARRYTALAEFARLLSLLVRYGLPLSDAIRLSAGGLRDADLRLACYELAMKVDAGQSLSEAADATNRFPREMVHLFGWVHRDNNFADCLANVAEVLSAQGRVHSQVMAAVCEPVLTVLLGGMVGLAVIALFYPLVYLLNALS